MAQDDHGATRRDDPAYQGANPHVMSTKAEPWNLFGAAHITGPSDHLTALLARNWWVVLLRGVFCIVFGLAAFFLPTLTLASLVLLFAAYMLVDGVLAIIAAVGAARRRRPWGMLVLEGVADLVAGAIAFFWPLVTIIAVVYLMGAWGIVSGALLLSAAFRLSLAPGRWLMALAAVLSMLWGVLVLLWPITGALALTLWLGAYAVIFGVMLLFLAARLRRLSHELPTAATA